ncbi:glutamine synthetase [Streptacidiphilus sp. MAP5-3]|uniref:glutamine synthetase n=1 Tax=unclassified Streptacidiphilus TaxID=2643834 RepID=UPI0035114836
MAERDEARAQARLTAARLSAEEVDAVALTWVDNAGIARVKGIPLSRLPDAAVHGIGMSPVFDVFLVDDAITTSRHIGGPDGDLRLFPDLDRAVRLAGQPGWAFVPVDRYAQDGTPHPACQRQFAAAMAARGAEFGITFRAAFETEWIVQRQAAPGEPPTYPTDGPAYGLHRLTDLSDYLRDVLLALEAQGLTVQQIHPEYAPGQFEVSIAAADPVAAADDAVLVRATIRAVSARHGLRASFAPAFEAGGVGNGGHLHLSAWQDGHNLMADPVARESFLGGILDELPALLALGAPSVASYLRLVPSHWAGVYRCWGVENREAALRVVEAPHLLPRPPRPATRAYPPVPGLLRQDTDAEEATQALLRDLDESERRRYAEQAAAESGAPANVEVKCFDQSANPYLAVGGVIAAGLAGMDTGAKLPEPAQGDPALLPPDRRPPRLPTDLGESLAAFRVSTVLHEALGEVLFEAVAAVRAAEQEAYGARPPEDVIAATRWRY